MAGSSAVALWVTMLRVVLLGSESAVDQLFDLASGGIGPSRLMRRARPAAAPRTDVQMLAGDASDAAAGHPTELRSRLGPSFVPSTSVSIRPPSSGLHSTRFPSISTRGSGSRRDARRRRRRDVVRSTSGRRGLLKTSAHLWRVDQRIRRAAFVQELLQAAVQ